MRSGETYRKASRGKVQQFQINSGFAIIKSLFPFPMAQGQVNVTSLNTTLYSPEIRN